MTGSLSDLMSKSAIRGNISQFDHGIFSVHEKGLDYIMGEHFIFNDFFSALGASPLRSHTNHLQSQAPRLGGMYPSVTELKYCAHPTGIDAV